MSFKNGTEVGTEVAGNTKAATQKSESKKFRGYLLTINNPTAEDTKMLETDDNFTYGTWQLEKGKDGTEHIQAFIYYKSARVWPKKKYPRAHIEPARSIPNSIKYCQKEDTRIAGPWTRGEMPEQGRRTDLEDIAASIITKKSTMTDIARNNPVEFIRYSRGLKALEEQLMVHRNPNTPPVVIWIWGLAGVGKTRSIWDEHGVENVYPKDGTQWWNGYTQQKVILIDDFDGKWPYRDFLRLIDRYPYQGQTKGGYVPINSPYIYITCEHPPEHIYSDETIEGSLLQKVTNNDNRLEQVKRRLTEIRNFTEDH